MNAQRELKAITASLWSSVHTKEASGTATKKTGYLTNPQCCFFLDDNGRKTASALRSNNRLDGNGTCESSTPDADDQVTPSVTPS